MKIDNFWNTFKQSATLFGIGLIAIIWGIKSLKEYKKEKYNPFKAKEMGYGGKIKMDVFFQSYGIILLGIFAIIVSIILLFGE